MKINVLVAFASKHGSTAEIAGEIGAVLTQAGLKVEVLPFTEVDGLENYQAAVLGSAVYAGHWRKEAARFLEVFAGQLEERSVWLFSSGPTGEGESASLLGGWRFPAELQALVDQIEPREITLFHGNLQLERLTLWEKWLVKGVKAPLGDFRDWEMIRVWAGRIAAALLTEQATSNLFSERLASHVEAISREQQAQS